MCCSCGTIVLTSFPSTQPSIMVLNGTIVSHRACAQSNLRERGRGAGSGAGPRASRAGRTGTAARSSSRPPSCPSGTRFLQYKPFIILYTFQFKFEFLLCFFLFSHKKHYIVYDVMLLLGYFHPHH